MRSKIDERTKETLRQISTVLRQVRRQAGMSQAQLASEISMDRENYAKIERAEINVTVDTLVRIAHGVGMKVSFSLLPESSRKVRAAPERSGADSRANSRGVHDGRRQAGAAKRARPGG